MTASVHRLGCVKLPHGVYLASALKGIRLYIRKDLGDLYGYTAKKEPSQTKVTVQIIQNNEGRQCLLFKIVPVSELTERGRTGKRAIGVGTFCLEEGDQYRLEVPKTSHKKKNLYHPFPKCECPAEILQNGDLMVILPTYFQRKRGPFKELKLRSDEEFIKLQKRDKRRKTKRTKRVNAVQTLDPNYHHTIYVGDYRILCTPGYRPEVFKSKE